MSDEYTATSPAPAKRPPSDVMLNLKSSDLSFDALEFKKEEPSKRIRYLYRIFVLCVYYTNLFLKEIIFAYFTKTKTLPS